jgi:hypothetical protein
LDELFERAPPRKRPGGGKKSEPGSDNRQYTCPYCQTKYNTAQEVCIVRSYPGTRRELTKERIGKCLRPKGQCADRK